jgi:hypothetical protein
MHTRRLLLLAAIGMLAATALRAQFQPRKDYIWARDISVAANPTITLDGTLSEAVWAQAESLVIRYGQNDGNPGSGWKIMNGSGTPGDPANAVVKFLSDKSSNMVYIAVIARDSSVGGAGWENSDGILGGIYNRNQTIDFNGLPLHQDIFISYLDSSGVGQLANLTGGNLPGRGIVQASMTIQGVANEDTNSSGARVADQGWILEMAVSLDSLGYNANSATTDAMLMTLAIWDADWTHGGGTSIATKAWWACEWGNSGGGIAGRVLLRNDVNINTAILPAYGPDVVIPNGQNYADVVPDGDLNEEVWAHVPSFNIEYGNLPLRDSYPTIGPYRSGWYVPRSAKTGGVLDAGMATIKMFFKGDKLFIGADITDQSLNHYNGDDFFDGLQLSMNIPIDTLRDAANQMASQRFGVAIDSVSKGGSSLLWDAVDWASKGALSYGVALKSASTIDNNDDIDNGFTLELALDLTKMGYPSGQPDKVVAIGLNYHDYDMSTSPADTSAERTWWFREWPWSSSPAFCTLSENDLVTGVDEKGGPTTANEFRLYGNYPNPFNPATRIEFSLPAAGTARLEVYDVLGRLVSQAQFSVTSGGMQERTFDASRLASGVYYYRLEFVDAVRGVRQMTETRKMICIK